MILLSSCSDSEDIDQDLSEEAFVPFDLLEGKIAFSRGQGRIAIIDADKKTVQHINTKDNASIWRASLAFSPDGTTFVYAGYHFTYNAYTIFKMDVDGGNAKKITNPGTQSFHGFAPVWSPDGQRIYYMSGTSNNGKIYSVNIDGSDWKQETDFTVNGRVSISPDGTTMALCKSHTRKTEGVFIYHLNSKELLQVADHDSTMIVHSPMFSPDGTQLAYIEMHGPNQPPYQAPPYYSRIHIIDISSGEDSMIAELPFEGYPGDSYLCWSPGGQKLAFNYGDGVKKGIQVYVINTNGTGMTQISQSDSPYPEYDGAPTWIK